MENGKILGPQKDIGADSLPLPDAWAQTVTDDLAHYWERKAEMEQLPPCERDNEDEEVIDVGFVGPFFTIERSQPDAVDDEDELEQGWLPGYDITDDHE
jgi:hypothetical protein